MCSYVICKKDSKNVNETKLGYVNFPHLVSRNKYYSKITRAVYER